MVVSNLKGGLGNYLFQIAAGYSLALDEGVVFKIDLSKIRVVHSHWDLYMSNFFRNVEKSNGLSDLNNYRYESLTYKPIPYVKDCLIDGYYQSEKYFSNNEKEIKELFEIDNESYQYINNKYIDILTSENTCSIHVRRGDFLKIPFYNKLDMDYYNKAIDEMGRDKKFIIFSNDISWCKSNFCSINATFIEQEHDYIDMYLMSLCKNNITSNSTFSWWGSYLNLNKNKKVITPNVWFVSSHSNEDLTPKCWIKI